MSAENYIASAARALAEVAKQILASHGVDVDDMFDLEASATPDTSEGEGGAEIAGESADTIFDVSIEEPEKAVNRMTESDGISLETARAEYADNLSYQIELMQRDIMDYERWNHPNPVLKGKLDELYDRLSALRDDINGGATDMDALKGYYNRLDTIKKDGMKLA